jgi:hypothetical protein
MTIAQSQRNTPAPRMYVGYPGLFGMFEVGDHANLAFAFCRPHVTSRFVLNRQNHPQTAHPRIIITNQTALHAVMHLPFRLNALRINPLSIQIVMRRSATVQRLVSASVYSAFSKKQNSGEFRKSRHRLIGESRSPAEVVQTLKTSTAIIATSVPSECLTG